ncbi:MAG TPA: FkbM family methyltransferase [Fibrobacteria bacterium]|nr:FkbM family methyltransferase [Fibrobacteria bacterium]
MSMETAFKNSVKSILPETWIAGYRLARQGAASLPDRVLLRVLEALPVKSRLFLKSNMNLVRKMDYEKHPVFLNIDSIVEYRVRLRSCRKEPEMIEWIETTMRAGDVLFDVGANVGAYSLVAAKFFQGEVRTYAFEPSFINFGQLCRNVALNGCGECVFPMPVALSDETKVGDFFYFDLLAGGALNAFGEAVNDKGEAFKATLKHSLLSFRTDDLIKTFNLPPPTHIKIDVDGLEMKVLEGARDAIAHPGMRGLIIELGLPEQADFVVQFMQERGLTLQSKHRRGRKGSMNYVFARKEAAASVR